MLNYSINMISGFVREIGRAPHRIFNEVPINFGTHIVKVSAEREPQAIVATLIDCPVIPVYELMEFINNLFRNLAGYRVTVRITGGIALNKFADQYLHVINETWLTEYRITSAGKYELEILRCVPRKEGKDYAYSIEL